MAANAVAVMVTGSSGSFPEWRETFSPLGEMSF